MMPNRFRGQFKAFASSAELNAALAAHVARALRASIESSQQASLAVSGGRTPLQFFEALSAQPLDWDAVAVTLVDERWVEQDSERSNARLVRAHLLQNQAATAHFFSLKTADAEPEAALANLNTRLSALPLPFAAVVLGMGEDGHTASFFPDGDRLSAALNLESPDLVQSMRAQGAGEPRVTLTLAALLKTDALILHIEGEKKRAVFEVACGPGAREDMPVRAVMDAAGERLQVYWSG